MEEKQKSIELEILNKEVSLEDLIKKYELSKVEIMSIVHNLKTSGINVSTVKKNGDIYLTSLGHKKLVDDSAYTIVDNSDEIKFALISDLRYGSKYQQKSIVDDALKKAYDFGSKYVFIAGDISEGMYSGEKQKVFNDALFAKDVEEQADYIIDNHAYIKGVNQYFITGEHDLTHLTKTYQDIGILISNEREDMKYLGQYLKKITFVNDDNNNEINILLQHQGGKVPYTVSYKPQQYAVSIRSEEKLDVLALGHFLTADRFKTRDFVVYSTPSMCATTPEMRKNGLNNVIGAWIITIKKDGKGKVESISQLFIPYYQTITNDYKTSKTLRLGVDK